MPLTAATRPVVAIISTAATPISAPPISDETGVKVVGSMANPER